MKTLTQIHVYSVLIVTLSLALLYEGYCWLSDHKQEEGLYTEQIVWIPKKKPFSLAEGYRLLNAGEDKKALPHFVYALKKDPKSVTLLMETAYLFHQFGKKDTAFRLLLQAYKLGDSAVKHKSINAMMVIVPDVFEGAHDPHLIVASLLYKNERKDEALDFIKESKP